MPYVIFLPIVLKFPQTSSTQCAQLPPSFSSMKPAVVPSEFSYVTLSKEQINRSDCKNVRSNNGEKRGRAENMK